MMNIFKKTLQFFSVAIVSVSSASLVQAETEFRGKYFTQSFLGAEPRGSSVREGQLLDSDLIRGNNNGEAVIAAPTNLSSANPFEFLNANTTERSLTVLFDDGSTVQNIRGLLDPVLLNFGVNIRYYAFSEVDLAAAGKSVDQVVDVLSSQAVAHGLNWSDLGFAEVTIIDDPAPTADDIIRGTNGNDRLVGTDGVDVLISEGGSRDRMTGGEGADFFVVGAEASDGVRGRDLIFDFESGVDTLVMTNGTRIQGIRARNGNFIINLTGSDRDRVILRNTSITRTSQINIINTFGDFDLFDIQPQPAPTSNPVAPTSNPSVTVTSSGLVSILGTERNDNLILRASGGDDAIDGLSGSDIVDGNLGNDFFLFGSSVSDGVTDRDTILNFNTSQDTIVLEQGISIVSVDERSTGISITLSGGDNDVIFVQGSSISRSGIDALNIISENGSFLESR